MRVSSPNTKWVGANLSRFGRQGQTKESNRRAAEVSRASVLRKTLRSFTEESQKYLVLRKAVSTIPVKIENNAPRKPKTTATIAVRNHVLNYSKASVKMFSKGRIHNEMH